MTDDSRALSLPLLFGPGVLFAVLGGVALYFGATVDDLELVEVVGWVLLVVAAVPLTIGMLALGVETGIRNSRQ